MDVDGRLHTCRPVQGVSPFNWFSRAKERLSPRFPGRRRGVDLLSLSGNRIRHFSLLAGHTNLAQLDLSQNELTTLVLPNGLGNLSTLNLRENVLTTVELPAGLTNLSSLNLESNRLARLTLPNDLSSLRFAFLMGNYLTELVVPKGTLNLGKLELYSNPLQTLVLPESVAQAPAPPIHFLHAAGISVHLYPLEVRLLPIQPLPLETFAFTLTGPPGPYAVESSTDLQTWNELAWLTNATGSVLFNDNTAARAFYRAKVWQ